MSQQPATAAEAAGWLQDRGYEVIYLKDYLPPCWLVRPFPYGELVARRIEAKYTDEELIEFTIGRQQHLAAGPDAWLREPEEG